MPTWDDSFKIGVPLIDLQHKTLFDAMDALYAACSEGKGRQEVAKTAEFLENYVIEHFAEEEGLQKRSAYPKYPEHKKIHEDFIVQVKSLKKDIAEHGVTIMSVATMNTMLSGWLLNHIKYMDTELAQYVKK
ncbi:MAG: bacteriohemerythrin [Acetanaerobacterium sp.]